MWRATKTMVLPGLMVALVLLTACSIEKKEGEDGNKKVNIETPFAQIRVGTDTDAKDTGITGYPGARPKEDGSNDKHRATVSIGGDEFGVNVAAASYVSDDPPEKVIDFYRKDLKRYGNVLECPKGISEKKGSDGEEEIRCSDRGSVQPGKMDLAVGVPSKQRIVSVKPNGKGTEFSLVYVQVRGGRETL